MTSGRRNVWTSERRNVWASGRLGFSFSKITPYFGAVFSRIRYPEKVSPEELDDYLASGWRCMGQAIYTSHFMFFPVEGGKRVFSTIPTRLPLEGYAFRKSLRRLWRRNQGRFRVEAGHTARFDAEKNRVNRLYARDFPRRALGSGEEILDNGRGELALDTREVRIYDGDVLVAFSFFDRGKESLYSKQGIYDPAYQKYSLGFFTMLVEIAYAQEQGLRYYYPGYVVPGNAEFDYKHRIGPLEYYELKSGSWKPFTHLTETDIPIHYVRRGLYRLQEQLAKHSAASSVLDYRHFDIRFYDRRAFPFLEFPTFLLCASQQPESLCPIAVFDPIQLNFHLYNCRFFGFGLKHKNTYHELLDRRRGLCENPVAVFDILQEECSLETAVAQLLKYAP